MIMRRVLLALAAFVGPAFAGDQWFENSEPVTLRSDTGYILVRSWWHESLLETNYYSPILVRTLSVAEIEAAKKDGAAHEANVVVPRADHAYARTDNEVTTLVPLKPGTYVLAGLGNIQRSGTTNITVITALCMGTVAFEVSPGTIIDLGTIVTARHARPTDVPELAAVVAGENAGWDNIDVAIRPAGSAVPEALKPLPILAADYRAFGWIPNYLGGPFARLAPMPGVLSYDKDGNAVDPKDAATTAQ